MSARVEAALFNNQILDSSEHKIVWWKTALSWNVVIIEAV